MSCAVPGREVNEKTEWEPKDLAAKYAAVASKSMVESSIASSKHDSLDSMVPEPSSDASNTPLGE